MSWVLALELKLAGEEAERGHFRQRELSQGKVPEVRNNSGMLGDTQQCWVSWAGGELQKMLEKSAVKAS